MKEATVALIEQAGQEKDIFVKAKLLSYIKSEHDVSTNELSNRLHLKPSYLCHILRLNKLPDIIIDGYYGKLITISHLFIISRLKIVADMIDLYEQILSENFSVLQTDQAVREKLYKTNGEGDRLEKEEVKQIEEALHAISKDVSFTLIQTRIKGKFVVEIKGGRQKSTQILRIIGKHLRSASE